MIYHNDIYEFRVVRIFKKRPFQMSKSTTLNEIQETLYYHIFIHVYLDNGKQIPWKRLLMVPTNFFISPASSKTLVITVGKKDFLLLIIYLFNTDIGWYHSNARLVNKDSGFVRITISRSSGISSTKTFLIRIDSKERASSPLIQCFLPIRSEIHWISCMSWRNVRTCKTVIIQMMNWYCKNGFWSW